jgi:membrane fusion protein (multidrug efflux system)
MLRSLRLRLGLLLLTGALLLVLSGCGGNSQVRAAANAPPPMVQVALVERRNVALTSEWIATMDGYINAEIQPHVSGYLIRQNYREGSFVRKGEVLFEIDPRPFQAALDQAQAQLAQTRAQVIQAQAQLAKAVQDVSRDTPLAQARAIAQSQLDNDLQAKNGAEAAVVASRAAVTAAQASVEQAQLNFSFTKIVSLVDGVAGIAKAQIGDLVTTTSVLTSVSQVNPIKVYFPISEQDYLRAQKIGTQSASIQSTPLKGSPLTLLLADGEVYPHQGSVLWSDRQVDPSTGTIRIAAAFPNPGNILRPGEYGRVRAVTEDRHDALLVPQAAVTELQGIYQVAVVGNDNKVRIQNVQIGSQVGSDWIVNRNLEAGERVVVGGMQYARQGATVNPMLVVAAPRQER